VDTRRVQVSIVIDSNFALLPPTFCLKCCFASASNVACPYGSYSIKPSSSSCESCPRGSATGVTAGGSSCFKCTLGLFSATDQSALCLACPPGKFSNTKGAIGCTDCPIGAVCPLASATPMPAPLLAGSSERNPISSLEAQGASSADGMRLWLAVSLGISLVVLAVSALLLPRCCGVNFSKLDLLSYLRPVASPATAAGGFLTSAMLLVFSFIIIYSIWCDYDLKLHSHARLAVSVELGSESWLVTAGSTSPLPSLRRASFLAPRPNAPPQPIRGQRWPLRAVHGRSVRRLASSVSRVSNPGVC
jgi:hypothetical protein